ncbi:MAG: SAF domain-containing protein [Candidatus Hadarchaeales archaeon]
MTEEVDMKRNAMLLVVAVVLGVIGGLAVFLVLSSASGTTKAVVAARDLPAFRPLREGDVEVVEVSKKEYERLGGVSDPEEVLGMVLAYPLPQGSLVTPKMLSESVSAAYTGALNQGEAAVSIAVHGENGMGGNISSGSTMHLYLSMDGTAKLLVPSVRVLDVIYPSSSRPSGREEEYGMAPGLVGQDFVAVIAIPEGMANIVVSAVSLFDGSPSSEGFYLVFPSTSGWEGPGPSSPTPLEGGTPIPEEGGVD